MYKKKKNHSCITCIILFIHHLHQFVLALYALIHLLHIIENDLGILSITTEFLVSESNHQIERYHMIKFAQSICIVSR